MIPDLSATDPLTALLGGGLTLLVQLFLARLGLRLPLLAPPGPAPAPGPQPAPAPEPAPVVLPGGGGLLPLLLRLLPLLLSARAKGQVSAEDKEAVRLLRQCLPDETRDG